MDVRAMILSWVDHEGDEVAIESAAIIGISVGTVTRPLPRPVGAPDITVTLVWCAGAAQPFMVAAPFAEVLDAWKAARTAGPPSEQPGFHGWPVNWWEPHPSTVMPGASSWAGKRGAS